MTYLQPGLLPLVPESCANCVLTRLAGISDKHHYPRPHSHPSPATCSSLSSSPRLMLMSLFQFLNSKTTMLSCISVFLLHLALSPLANPTGFTFKISLEYSSLHHPHYSHSGPNHQHLSPRLSWWLPHWCCHFCSCYCVVHSQHSSKNILLNVGQLTSLLSADPSSARLPHMG